MAIGTWFAAVMAASSIGVSALPSQSKDIRDINFGIPSALISSHLYGAPANNFSCKSSHNPVVMLHGLSASREVDLNLLQYELNDRGYCTFSSTYGAHPIPSWIGGLTDMTKSAAQIADFIREVKRKTGAAKVDIVGHSEGGVQSIYVPMTQAGIAEIVEHVVALGPAIHGATYFGFTDLWYIGGDLTRALVGQVLDVVGCPACDQLAVDGLVTKQFASAAKIAQPGNKVTVIGSTKDTLVPVEVSTIDEADVKNVLVQTTCPDDPVGHAGLAWDKSVWRLIVNALEETDEEVYKCEKGLPF
ncbi:Alpha/Beta hydrolase protein [Xylaria bambusicola]|uniref:Alpha/Beta hydrolase protein n=1 Tax=Xylaria bambusicola TaxID=326684 RepID=UPI002008299E|nr:Alpha/Beta hydrolase protein [Xylaria bambusicola]KAI0509653.1 Alpha/Beta hydrolase protein [Xylaria bambusicola]